jgi:hypothetical protein
LNRRYRLERARPLVASDPATFASDIGVLAVTRALFLAALMSAITGSLARRNNRRILHSLHDEADRR